MEPLDVVGLGFCCVDELLLLTEIPPPEGRAIIRQRAQQGGGMVATAMVAVARLGGRAGFVSKVGDDATGQWIGDDFRRFGVDVSRLVVQPGHRSHRTVVLVDEGNGARTFLSDRGTVSDIQPEELDRDYLTSAAVLHLSDASPAALQAAEWARAAGKAVCFDGTHFHPTYFQLAPYITDLVVSRFFASEFMSHRRGGGIGRAAAGFASLTEQGRADQHIASLHPTGHGTGDGEDSPATLQGEQLLEAAEALRGTGPDVVVVTEGEAGSWCAAPGERFHTEAFPQAHVVDTTGAGDVFHGAYLYARSRGIELRPALRLAAATASLKCRALGGRAGIPTWDEVMGLTG